METIKKVKNTIKYKWKILHVCLLIFVSRYCTILVEHQWGTDL